MSSFVIDKQEYIKAAGLMYGIESTKRDKHQMFLEHVRDEFVNAYRLNVMSVNEQYGENAAEDERDYDDTFEAYRKIGELIGNDGYVSKNGIIYEQVEGVMSLTDLRVRLWNFFRSVLYQIENEDAHCTVSEFFFNCMSKLYERDLRGIEGWWGEVELAA